MAGRAIDIGIIIREQFPERAKRGGIDLGVGDDGGVSLTVAATSASPS